MAGLVPAIHVFLSGRSTRCGCPAQGLCSTRRSWTRVPGMTENDSADNPCRRYLWREWRGCHQPVGLLDDISGFRILGEEKLPIRILHHLCAFLFTVCRALVDPAMHQSVELTCFADEIIVRLAHVSQLHGVRQLAVEVELRRHSAWQNSICAVVNEH